MKTTFIQQCRDDRARYQRDLKELESGALRLGRKAAGKDWEDITLQEIERYKKIIANHDEIIGTYDKR
jgi:hypothetical protein